MTAGLAEAVPTADALLLGAGVDDETRPLDRVVVAQATSRTSGIAATDDRNLMLL